MLPGSIKTRIFRSGNN